MEYNGPKTRNVERYQGDGFEKQGRVGYTEDRAVYIQQSFKIKQKLIEHPSNGRIEDYWYSEDEKAVVNPDIGDYVHMTQSHTFDRLALNQSLQNVTFKPDQCFNALEIENDAVSRLAPLLTTDAQYKNVTRPAEVDLHLAELYPGQDTYIPDTIHAQFGAYNRLWFGWKENVEVANVPGHNGLGPIANALHNGNVDRRIAMGCSFMDVFYPQKIKNNPSGFLGDFGNGNIAFNLTADGIYKSSEFDITIPMDHLFQGWENAGNLTLTVPEISFKPMSSMSHKQNAFLLQNSDVVTRMPENAEFVVLGVIQEDINMKDFISVPLGMVNRNSDNSGNLEEFYLFIPKARNLQGNWRTSFAQPRRFVSGGDLNGGINGLQVTDAPWLQYNTPPIVSLAAGVDQAAVTTAQTQFFADYWTRKTDGGFGTWDYVPIARLHQYNANGNPHRFLTFEYPAGTDTFSTAVRALVDRVQFHCVTHRVAGEVNNGAFHPCGITSVLFILGGSADTKDVHGNHIVRLNLDRLNSWIAGGNPVNHADQKNYVETVAMWNNGDAANNIPARSVQMETDTYENNPFGLMRNEEDLNNTQYELDDHTAAIKVQQDIIEDLGSNVNQIAAAKTARGLLFRRNAKSFYWRSVFNLADDAETVAFPALGNAFWTSDAPAPGGDPAPHTRLFLPKRIDQKNSLYGYPEENVTCVEPFFGYSSATSSLGCDHPLDTARLGRRFPGLIQDYTYHLTRDFSKLFKKGYIQDQHCQTEVTETTPLTFTTIRERESFEQADKSVSRIGEVTHTLNKYSKPYVQGETPSIEIETRSGQFEYAFLYCDFDRISKADHVMPTSEPIITSIRYTVFGKENQFVRTLDKYDVERISRGNCNTLSKWRDFHNAGQGILLHLSDLGLTEEVAFPRRGRMKLEFTLLTTQLPEIETYNHFTTEDIVDPASTHTRTFTVCLLRHNQLLKGDVQDMRFSYYNES